MEAEPVVDAQAPPSRPRQGFLHNDARIKSVTKLMGYGASLLAVASMFAAIFSSSTLAVLIAGLALVLACAPIPLFILRPLPESKSADEETLFKQDLLLNGFTILLSIAFLALVLVSVLAVFAAFGAFVVFGDFAEGFVDLFIIVLAGPVALLALALPVAMTSNRYGAQPLNGHSVNIAWATTSIATVLGMSALAIQLGFAESAGFDLIKRERASFILAGMAIAAYLAVRVAFRIPDLRTISDWIEHEPRFRDSNIPRATVIAASGFAGIAVIVSVLAGFGILPEAAAIYALVAATLTLLVAAFSMGVTHVEARLEFGEDVASARHQRKLILGGLSVALAILALGLSIVTILAILAQAADVALFKSLLEIFVANHPLILAIALLPSVATIIARVYVPTDVKYTDRAKVFATVLATVIVILAFYGGFIGSGLAQGAGIELSNAVLILAASVVALTLFVRTRALLPGIVSMVRERIDASTDADIDTKASIRRNMIATYVVSTVFIFGFIGFIVASSLGVMPVADGVATDLTFFGVLVGGIILLVVLVMRYFQGVNIDPQWSQSKKAEEDIKKKRLSPEELNRYLILGFSISAATALGAYGLLLYFDIVNALGPLDLEPKYATDFFVFALLIGLGPYGWYQNKEVARTAAIDSKFPEFLRDLAESERSGMTLTRAVVTASKGHYGALTWEIRKMAAQIEWGISFTEAITRFAKRVRTPLIERTVSLIVEASNAGGSVLEVLSAAAEDSREIQLILKERKSAMSIYVMIIYVAFFVFVGVVGILNAMFIPEVAKAMAGADGVKIGSVTFQAFDEQAFATVFFHAAIIQGLGGGLVAGVMEGGKPVAGLKHAFVMITMAYVVFRFMIGG